MSNTYNADAIEVLSGLDPVRKRPGMYTDTTRPNHLAAGGHRQQRRRGAGGLCPRQRSTVTTATQTARSRSSDDGRGMPVDMHLEQKRARAVSKLILSTLHAGGKFSGKSNYQDSVAVCTAWGFRWSMRCPETPRR